MTLMNVVQGGIFVVAIVLVYFVLRRSLRQSAWQKSLDEPKVFDGMVRHRNNTTYVSAMAIITAIEEQIDISTIRPEAIDRVMRLRLTEIVTAIMDKGGRVKDQSDRERLCRMATVYSAMHGVAIPNELVLIDRETKALLQAVSDRMELRLIRCIPFGDFVIEKDFDHVPYLKNRYTPQLDAERRALIRRYASIDQTVQHEFLKMLGQNEFDFFHKFCVRCRQRFNYNQRQYATDDVIKSVLTAWAARTGINIPKSYMRIDEISILLMNWDSLPQPFKIELIDNTKVVYTRPADINVQLAE